MKALLFAILIFLPIRVQALTPPWDEEDLRKGADLIVEGEMGSPLKCLGLVDQSKCWNKFKYVIPLTVAKVIKTPRTFRGREVFTISGGLRRVFGTSSTGAA